LLELRVGKVNNGRWATFGYQVRLGDWRGMTIEERDNDVADVAVAGVVAELDHFAPIGGLDHSPREYIQVSSIVPRTALLALLMLRRAQQG
jgi:hypothetical protein